MFVLFYPLHPQPTGWLETNPNESFAMEHNHHQQTSLSFVDYQRLTRIWIYHIYMCIYIYYHVMNIYHQKHRKVDPKYKWILNEGQIQYIFIYIYTLCIIWDTHHAIKLPLSKLYTTHIPGILRDSFTRWTSPGFWKYGVPIKHVDWTWFYHQTW